MTILEEIKKYKIQIIITCVCLFVIGYLFGTWMGYVSWCSKVDNTVEFLSELKILGKGDYDINKVKAQIDKIYEVHNKGDYFQTVKELKKLEEIYPNLQVEGTFQRLMEKIE